MSHRRLLDEGHVALALRLTLVMALYTLCRGVFLVANHDLFADLRGVALARAFAGGLVFDASAVAYTNLPLLVLSLLPVRARTRPGWQATMRWLFVVVNALTLALDCLDVAYYRFSLRRTTASVFQEFSGQGHLATVFLRGMLDYWWVTLLWVGLVAVLVLVARRAITRDVIAAQPPRLFYPAAVTVWLAVLFFAAVAGRGGFFTRYHRPITLSNAGAWVDQPHHVGVVLNTPFSMMRTLHHSSLKRLHHYATERELEAAYTPVHAPVAPPPGPPLNVVLVILESFGAEHVGALNRGLEGGTYQGFTPFLDSLMDRSLTFTNAFANGRKTIDAMPSVTASIPSLVEPFILSHYSSDHVNSLASELKRRGYSTMFFHSAPNGSMGFEAFVRMAGYDRYFGFDEYGNPKDFDGTWGIWDEEFFQYFARELGRAPEPFLATLFSISSHHPYKVPERYIGKFKKGRMHVEEVISYTDYALGRMFDALAQLPSYSRTLFVITADHGSALNRPEYQTMVGRFRIPLLFFRGDGSLVGRDDRPAQQLDVLPTVLHLAGATAPFVAFGNDLLDPNGHRFVINYADGTFQLIQGDWVLHWDGNKTTGLFHYAQDPLLADDRAAAEPEVRQRLEALVEAVLQQYNARMIDDRLTTGVAGQARLP